MITITLHSDSRERMNDKYYVSEKNRKREFTVTTDSQMVCGTLCVWMDGFRGCYAVDGLEKI
jgi:hypothetical protein